MYGLRITAEPTIEPFTTVEAKIHIGIASAVTYHDSYIDSLVIAARKYAEYFTGRSLLETEWEFTLDSFQRREIYIPRSPLIEVVSVEYLDTEGDSQTFDAAKYRVSTGKEPAEITLAYGQAWPSVRFVSQAVTITFTAGYTDAASIPGPIKQAMLLLVKHWFDNRSEVDKLNLKQLPMAANHLLEMYRVGDEFVSYSREYSQ